MAEYIAEVIGFVFVVAVIVKWVVPPVRKMTGNQQEAIRAQLAEAEQAKQRLAAARAEYEQAVAQAAKEADQMREEARHQGESILQEMRDQAQHEARRIVEQARQQIEADRTQAVNRLRVQLGRLSAELAGRIVNTSMRADDRQLRVIDRFIDELDDMAPASAPAKEQVGQP